MASDSASQSGVMIESLFENDLFDKVSFTNTELNMGFIVINSLRLNEAYMRQ